MTTVLRMVTNLNAGQSVICSTPIQVRSESEKNRAVVNELARILSLAETVGHVEIAISIEIRGD